MDAESIDVRGHCVEMLSEIIHHCGLGFLVDRLPALLDHFYTVATEVNDLEYNAFIFPFISMVVKTSMKENASLFASLEPYLQRFMPYFDSILYSTYGPQCEQQ